MTPQEPLVLRTLNDGDVREIRGWPAYEGDVRALDYALRPGGWLDQFPDSATSRRFGLSAAGTLEGFSILTDITPETAEIYLAVRPGQLGRGIGRALMERTLATAFGKLKLRSVHLKVRLWHTHAIALYEKLGFVSTGNKRGEVAGEPVDFTLMELEAARFRGVSDP